MKNLSLIFLFLSATILKGQITSQLIGTLFSPNEETDGQFGESVAAVGGDINFDGIPDLLIGARSEDPGLAAINSGLAYIMSGIDGMVLHTLSSPNPEYWGYFGSSVAGLAGDVNSDGIADVLVGAPYEDPGVSPVDAGRAYVFSGMDGSLLYELISPAEVAGGQFGTAVSGLGSDVDGDGIVDLLVGAPYEQALGGPSAAGRVHVFSGIDGHLIYTLISPNEESSGFFGWSAAGIGGDANYDSIPDLLVGAYIEDPGSSPSNAGRAYLFSGVDGALLFELSSPNEESNGYFGRTVSGAGGDLDNDGAVDILVGAFWEDPGSSPPESGRAYAFSGASGNLLHTFVSPGEKENGWFAYAVSGTGADVNEDGIPDILVGAPLEGESDGLNAESGRAYLFSGADASLLQTINAPFEEADGWFACSLSEAGGDLDEDGTPDFIVGAERKDIGLSPNNAGSAFTFSAKGFICSDDLAPANQQHTYLPNRVVLSWDPQLGATGCQVQVKQLPGGFQATVNVLASPFNSISIPYAVTGAGTSWTWRVRCACSLSPLQVTPFSNFADTFSIPILRDGELDGEIDFSGPIVSQEQLIKAVLPEDIVSVFPNPSRDFIELQNPILTGEIKTGIFDLQGSAVKHQLCVFDGSPCRIDISNLPDGIYLVRFANKLASSKFVISR